MIKYVLIVLLLFSCTKQEIERGGYSEQTLEGICKYDFLVKHGDNWTTQRTFCDSLQQKSLVNIIIYKDGRKFNVFAEKISYEYVGEHRDKIDCDRLVIKPEFR